MYTHFFKYPQRKKLGTIGCDECTGHGIPDTWKYAYWSADKSLARPGRKQAAPLKSVMGRVD